MNSITKQKAAFVAAFPYTVPVLTGFSALGFAYGIYMRVSGFPYWYSMLMGILVFGGSLQFLAVSLLLSPFAPVQTLIVAFMLQARHLFYGIAMLPKYKNMGWKKFYLIFGMCDESFSINYTAAIPEDVDRGWFYFFVTLLDQCYWVIASALGGIVGSFITFSTEGLDFVMTAMFVVIFMEQCKKEKQPYGALCGIIFTLAARLIFGADRFLVPAMILITVFLILFRGRIEKAGDIR